MLYEELIKKGLSNRETEVVSLVVRGLSNKDVAGQLFVTEKTVKFHLTNIYRKMSVKSRAQLLVWSLPYLGFEEKKQNSDNVQTLTEAPPWDIPSGITKVGNA